MNTYAEKMIAKGREEGFRLGYIDVLEMLLTHKFGEIPSTYRAQIEQATIEQIEQYAVRVLTVDSLEAVFAD